MSNAIATFEYHPRIAPCKSQFDPSIHDTWYKMDYAEFFRAMTRGDIKQRDGFASLFKGDLFAIVCFAMGIEKANHPFIVKQCRLVEEGPESGTVDIWAREHFKSTIITIGRTIKRILNDPESTTAIFSYKKPAAEKFLDGIRKVLESPLMVWTFPDILYEKPDSQAPSWSLQGGIRVKRNSTSRREHTVEAFGLIEGMPTGGHFDHRIYDDVETDDLAQNPEQLQLCFNKFEMSRNLGSDGGTESIIGTYYSHCGVLVKLGEKKNILGEPMYDLRIFPATDNGKIDGNPVFFSQEYLDSKKTDSTFSTQQLCNPTPGHERKIHFDRFKSVSRGDLPSKRIKVMIVDPAGDKEVQTGNKNDRWAMVTIGVKPFIDDLGLSDIYIEDGICDEFASSESNDAACDMYIRNGRISVLGVERVATDSAWLHIKNALKAKGRYMDLMKKEKVGGNLMLLAPSGRAKMKKILDNLEYPLNNGKVHIVDDINPEILTLLKTECDKFPFFHVDLLDAISYVYDVLSHPNFLFTQEKPKNPLDKLKKNRHSSPATA